MSNLFHELFKIWFNASTKQQKNKITFIRVRNTGRPSRRIPAVAPYNFGISSPWLDRAREDPANTVLLHGWGTFKNPPGFDADDSTVDSRDAETVTDEGAAAISGAINMSLEGEELNRILADPHAVDPRFNFNFS